MTRFYFSFSVLQVADPVFSFVESVQVSSSAISDILSPNTWSLVPEADDANEPGANVICLDLSNLVETHGPIFEMPSTGIDIMEVNSIQIKESVSEENCLPAAEESSDSCSPSASTTASLSVPSNSVDGSYLRTTTGLLSHSDTAVINENLGLLNSFENYLSTFAESLHGFEITEGEELIIENSSNSENISNLEETSNFEETENLKESSNLEISIQWDTVNTSNETGTGTFQPAEEPHVPNTPKELDKLLNSSLICCPNCLAVLYISKTGLEDGQQLCFACGEVVSLELCQFCSTIVQIIPGCQSYLRHLKLQCPQIIVADVIESVLDASVLEGEIRKENAQVCADILNDLISLSVDLKESHDLSSIQSIICDIIYNLPDKETELFNKYKPVYNLMPTSVPVKRMSRDDFDFFSAVRESSPEPRTRPGRRPPSSVRCSCCPDQRHVGDLVTGYKEEYGHNDDNLDEDIQEMDEDWRPKASHNIGKTNNRKQYVCQVCDKGFMRFALFERHREQEHPFCCNQCDMTTTLLDKFRHG